MSSDLGGRLDGEGLKVGIVVARFNETITSRLLTGAMASLSGHGLRDEDITVAYVPGSFEIPLIAKKMAASGKHDAVICLGAVIRGETDHHEHIAGEAARGISTAALETGVPVIFGVLTTDTVQQAVDRAGGQGSENVSSPRETDKLDSGPKLSGNSGYNAGVAAIHMANLLRDLDSR